MADSFSSFFFPASGHSDVHETKTRQGYSFPPRVVFERGMFIFAGCTPRFLLRRFPASLSRTQNAYKIRVRVPLAASFYSFYSTPYSWFGVVRIDFPMAQTV